MLFLPLLVFLLLLMMTLLLLLLLPLHPATKPKRRTMSNGDGQPWQGVVTMPLSFGTYRGMPTKP
jgi:hypothetical protein